MSTAEARRGVLPILIMVTAASIMSMDLYMPSLPHLPAYFNTTTEMVSLTVSLYVVVFGLAQLVHGPLADRFGRRPVLLLGMLAFTIMSLVCAFAWSIEALVVARLLQSVAAAVEAVVILAIIRDLYDEEEAVRILALYGMVVALAPAVAPLIGGYVHITLGWRANFGLLVMFAGVATFLVYMRLAESGVADVDALCFRNIVKTYYALLSNRCFMGYVLCMSMVYGGLWVYITIGSFVLIEVLEVETQHFGYYHAVIVLAYCVGSYAANRIVGRLGPDRLLLIGLWWSLLGGILLLSFVLLDWASAWLIVAGMAVFVIGIALTFASAPVKALNCVKSGTGSASALFNALEIVLGGSCAFVAGLLYDENVWPLAVMVFVAAFLGTAVYMIMKPWIPYPG